MSALQAFLTEHAGSILLWTPFVILLLGIWLGVSGRIVVYRNFSDLSLVFSLVLVPMVAFFVLVNLGTQDLSFARKPVLIFEGVMLCLIAFLTLRDNGWNPFKALLALYAKLPLGVLFVVCFMDALKGDTRQSRRNGLFLSAILMAVIVPLVRDKSGVFAPANAINRRMRRVAAR